MLTVPKARDHTSQQCHACAVSNPGNKNEGVRLRMDACQCWSSLSEDASTGVCVMQGAEKLHACAADALGRLMGGSTSAWLAM